MKLDAVVLGCLRGVGGASIVLAVAGCGASAPAEQGTTPAVAAQPAQDPQQASQDPAAQVGTTQSNEAAMAACGRG